MSLTDQAPNSKGDATTSLDVLDEKTHWYVEGYSGWVGGVVCAKHCAGARGIAVNDVRGERRLSHEHTALPLGALLIPRPSIR